MIMAGASVLCRWQAFLRDRPRVLHSLPEKGTPDTNGIEFGLLGH
jgi:hypothetical protein